MRDLARVSALGCMLAAMTGCPSSETGAGSDVTPPADVRDDAGEPAETDAGDTADGADVTTPDDGPAPVDVLSDVGPMFRFDVLVLLDGEPAPDVLVLQGGTTASWRTDPSGRLSAEVDLTVEGGAFLVASHAEARTAGVLAFPEQPNVTIELKRFDPSDNPDFVFTDPGEPTRSPTSDQCGHCHKTINKDWFDSPHRQAASNPRFQDLYAGVATALDSETSCTEAGGRWLTGVAPGGGEATQRCYLGDGVLPSLNDGCGDAGSSCDAVATKNGGCADCHAPGIDGQLGGRDVLEARGFAYDYGVHCDVCHHVESLDPSGAPGVAGFLHIVRPSEVPASQSLGDWLPLYFGPNPDVPNARMGNVPRQHFKESLLCAGCHEHTRAALDGGVAPDATRWPSGQLPISSTYSEWEASPFSGVLTCQGCHMPPDPAVDNSADLQLFPGTEGMIGGWKRAAGTVNKHTWGGPRTPGSGLLQQTATLAVETARDGDELTVTATLANTGAGHAFPTGEPLRSVLVLVEARCGDERLEATGGDAVPDFGGFVDRRVSGEDWAIWPGAAVGDVVRVVARPGGSYDYEGLAPFGSGGLSIEDRGMPMEHVVGSAVIEAVNGDVVTFDRPLPTGDIAYRSAAAGLPEDGDPATGRAGAPGFGFARVMVDASGRRMVPHFLAVDIASDNRLLAGAEWTSNHVFAATCETPEVRAAAVYRAYPVELARERRWTLVEQVVVTTP